MRFGLVAVEAHEVTLVDGLGASTLIVVIDEGDAMNAFGSRCFDDVFVDQEEPVLDTRGRIQEVGMDLIALALSMARAEART
jgi:hypothetical protein